ncbi:unnamed protein product [Nezara viridula]|uniref:Uncharacterized protein n=1 Tax=Nezara viridula TaxID=85310 RepID=A0A9P0HL45_NEZVI|nr:unnamed protein product [Nezara viridula]
MTRTIGRPSRATGREDEEVGHRRETIHTSPLIDHRPFICIAQQRCRLDTSVRREEVGMRRQQGGWAGASHWSLLATPTTQGVDLFIHPLGQPYKLLHRQTESNIHPADSDTSLCLLLIDSRIASASAAEYDLGICPSAAPPSSCWTSLMD